MKPNELVRERREELGLREAEVASYAGLSRAEYRDIEHDEDEAFTVVQLGKLRAIATLLKLDILSMFAIECETQGDDTSNIGLFSRPRNELISLRREALEFTREQLGDRIGFETIAVEGMERDPDFLERWSVELIQELAKALTLPVHVLLQVPCSSLPEKAITK